MPEGEAVPAAGVAVGRKQLPRSGILVAPRRLHRTSSVGAPYSVAAAPTELEFSDFGNRYKDSPSPMLEKPFPRSFTRLRSGKSGLIAPIRPKIQF